MNDKNPEMLKPSSDEHSPASGALWRLLKAQYLTATLIVVCVLLGLCSRSFFGAGNIANILAQSAFGGIAACGMTVLIAGGLIDLSVAGQIAICSIVVAVALPHMTIGAAFALALVLGVIMGLVNGLLVAGLRIPPFIATLGSLYLFLGAAFIFTDGNVVPISSHYFRAFTTGSISVVPIAFIVFACLAVLTYLLFQHTYFGREIRAVGSNERAAALAGISIPRVKTLAFVFAGFCFALSAMFICGRLSSAEGNMSIGYEMTVIAAVVIGGTSMRGGSGTIWGTVIGALLFTILGNALNLLGVPSYWQYVVTGVVLIVAISIGTVRQRAVPLRSE